MTQLFTSTELSSVTECQYFVTNKKHKILIIEVKFKKLIIMILKYGKFRHIAVKKVSKNSPKLHQNKTSLPFSYCIQLFLQKTEIMVKLLKYGSSCTEVDFGEVGNY